MKKLRWAVLLLVMTAWAGPVPAAEEESIPDLSVTGTASGEKVAALHVKKARDFFLLEALDQAQAEFELALAADPGSAEAHFGLGRCLEMKNDVRGAIREYLAAKNLDSRHFEAHSRLADLYASMSIFDKAIQEYRSAVEIDPRFSQGLVKIGMVYRKQGMLEEASQAFRSALAIDPENKLAIYNFASCRMDRGDARGACEEMDRLLGKVKKPETKKLVEKILIDLCTAP